MLFRSEELPFDHSLLAPSKILFNYLANHSGVLPHLIKPYLLIAGTIALLVFFVRAWHMPAINRIVFLFAAMVALPPVSYDYTLVHLYAPWAMLVIVALHAGADGVALPGFRTYFLCFAVLFTSQVFIYYHSWIHPNGPLKTLALVMLMAKALRYPIPDEALYEAVQPASAQLRQPQGVGDVQCTQAI